MAGVGRIQPDADVVVLRDVAGSR